MKRIVPMLLIATLFIFTSCEKDPFLSISLNEVSAPFQGNETSVVINTNNPWTIQSPEWCEVKPNAGEAGETTVVIHVKPNETYDPRECDIIVSSDVLTEVIKVTQLCESVIFTENTEYLLSWNPQVLTLPIQSNIGTQVSVSAEWIQFQEVKGLVSNNLIFNVQENETGATRDAEITIKDNESNVSAKVKVSQNSVIANLPEGCVFYEKVHTFITSKTGITKIKFITESAITSEDVLVEKAIYLVKNNETLEIHTPSSQFIAHNNCELMFSGDKYEDNTIYSESNGSFSQIESIDFGENFNTQNVKEMSHMFLGCRSLTSLDVTKFDTRNVTAMFSMFSGCNNLTSLDVSNFNTENVWTMYEMFAFCNSLKYLDVTNFDTRKVKDMTRMFGSCSSLTSLNLSNFNTENVESLNSMFSNCTNLRSVNLSSFNTQNVTNMGLMFYNCKNLTSLDLSNFSFDKNPIIVNMFHWVGMNAENRPVPIYVTSNAMQYIINDGTSGLNSDVFNKLVVKSNQY